MDAPNSSGNEHQHAEDRGIGPEKLSVRIFREIFTKAVLANGNLKTSLDEYLKSVLTNESAKRSDKTYARKIYTDLVRLAGGSGLPDWAKKQVEAEKPLTNGDIDEMLTGITPAPTAPKAMAPAALQCDVTGCKGVAQDQGREGDAHVKIVLCGPCVSEWRISKESYSVWLGKKNASPVTPAPDPDMYLDPNEISLDDPADVFLGGAPGTVEPDPFEPILKDIIIEYVAKTTHPFVRGFYLDGVQYMAVGTFVGSVVKGEHAGKKLNVNFTVNPYRTRRDIPPDVLIHRNGRAVQVMHEDERGCRRFLFVVKPQKKMKLRFWTRVGENDHPGGARFVILDNVHITGWKEVTRAEF
jgi:hypothetical protein